MLKKSTKRPDHITSLKGLQNSSKVFKFSQKSKKLSKKTQKILKIDEKDLKMSQKSSNLLKTLNQLNCSKSYKKNSIAR